MPRNALVTGPPRSGKTTALERTVSRLREQSYAVGGIFCPELREDGERVGFEIVGLSNGDRGVMAHAAFENGPSVGKYRVDVAAVDRIAGRALSAAVDDADCVVIDEIAPMELESERFVRETRRALDATVPTLAAITYHSREGFLGEVKSRTDVEVFEVTPETRAELPETLFDWVRTRRER